MPKSGKKTLKTSLILLRFSELLGADAPHQTALFCKVSISSQSVNPLAFQKQPGKERPFVLNSLIVFIFFYFPLLKPCWHVRYILSGTDVVEYKKTDGGGGFHPASNAMGGGMRDG
jgi:hypothetical protein